MTNIRTTYRRADGQQVQCFLDRPFLMVRWTDNLHMLQNIEPADYIQEEWLENILIRHRPIRLGADEPCENENCAYDLWCRCTTGYGIKGIKPRDTNPTWVENE